MALVAIAIISFLIEGVPLVRKRQTRDFTVYSVILAVGVGMLITLSAGVTIPSPVQGIMSIGARFLNLLLG